MKPGPEAHTHTHLIEVEGLNFRPGRVVKEDLLGRRAASTLGLDHATVDIVGIRGAFRGWRYLDLLGTVGPSCGFFVHHGLY